MGIVKVYVPFAESQTLLSSIWFTRHPSREEAAAYFNAEILATLAGTPVPRVCGTGNEGRARMANDQDLKRAVRLAALLNLAYFGIEMAAALRIGSVSLLADSADFFEDAAVNVLIFAALDWTPIRRARLGMALSAVLLLPVTAFVWTLWRKFGHPTAPDGFGLTATGLGALVVNLFCAFTLARFRAHSGSLTKAAFLSARNDAIANVGIIAAGIVTMFTRSLWADVIVGLGIAAMNADAARAVWRAAKAEHSAVSAQP